MQNLKVCIATLPRESTTMSTRPDFLAFLAFKVLPVSIKGSESGTPTSYLILKRPNIYRIFKNVVILPRESTTMSTRPDFLAFFAFKVLPVSIKGRESGTPTRTLYFRNF